MDGAADWGAGFYSRHLLTFAALWRREGAAGMPAALRACAPDRRRNSAGQDEKADAEDTEDSVLALWDRMLDATVRELDGSDNSRSLK